ncbi:MAG: CCA tRNA nucleotidyltransferase [Actinobacteria bacterium]|nr:CCA tRNA nucleotidyltransferase [Actinomycetota bacterium]
MVAGRSVDPVFVVGGAVRDCLAGRDPGVDIDLVVEGSAITLAEAVAEQLDAALTAHPAFGTAELSRTDGLRIDVASARRERYPAPGALPVVSPGTLREDLARRDLTVNAIAVRLDGSSVGEITAHTGALGDLADRRARILHPASLSDDPSRLVRLARYSTRLGLAIEVDTQTAARVCAPTLDVGSARVADEIVRTLAEAPGIEAFTLLGELGVSWITVDADASRAAAHWAALDVSRRRAPGPSFPVWTLRAADVMSEPSVDLLAVDGWLRDAARASHAGRALRARLREDLPMSDVDRALRRAHPVAVIVAHALGASAIGEWWARWRGHSLRVDGNDVVESGVPPGPEVGWVLETLRARVLDGLLADDRTAQLAAIGDCRERR